MGDEPLAKSGEMPITLGEHILLVSKYARMVANAYREIWGQLLGEGNAERVGKALILAAISHDLGKATDGFQRALRESGFHWEFRHEVLSASFLLSTSLDEEELELAIAAVLTHHRDLEDTQLADDSGWVAIPIPKFIGRAREKFNSKACELRAYWDWLRAFWQSQPELCRLPFPEGPEMLPLPDRFYERLEQLTTGSPASIGEKKTISLILTRGWLMAADHAVSAGVNRFLTSLPRPQLPPLRPFQNEVGNHKGDALLEAPTGSGKTNAAISWAMHNRRSGERIFYLLPYQASIEAMADTLEGMFGRENIAVIHARALDYAFREHFEKSEEYKVAASRAKLDVELNRLAHRPIKVATPFQLLKWLFGIPRWEIGICEMVGGLFIFDEIHAYDAHIVALIVEMVKVLKQLGGRFLFMSATFPPFLKELLQDALGDGAVDFGIDGDKADLWTRRFLGQVRHRIRWHDGSLEELLPEIEDMISQDKRVLIVANRVAQAQEIFQQLRESFDNIHLLHSRFTRRDRVRKERAIIEALKGKGTDIPIQALVATQVVEVSLDVSFDTIFTEIAPVDDLLQRFGRVNRYGEHADGVDVHIARQFDRERLIRVYDEERLMATLESAPEDGTPLTVETAEEWVRRVYRDGWTNKERKRYENSRTAFQTVLAGLRVLHRLEEGEEEFYGLFQSVEVLPRRFYEEYEAHLDDKRYLLANQLLVPVPLGTFHMLKSSGRLNKLKEGVLLADVAYSDELGLLPKEIDIDAIIF